MQKKGKLIVFLGLTFLLSCIFYYLIITTKRIDDYILYFMWCPGIAAIVTQLIYERNIQGFGWGLSRAKYMAIGFFLPVAEISFEYLAAFILGYASFSTNAIMKNIGSIGALGIISTTQLVAIFLALTAVISFVANIVAVLGEEIAWRGFLVPELKQSMPFWKTSLIIGLIWSIWHFPIILFADYRNSFPWWYAIPVFTAGLVIYSFVLAWLRFKSNSIWPCVLMHATSNLVIQSIFDPLTIKTTTGKFLLGEYGFGMIIITIVALPFVLKYKDRIMQGIS